MLAVSRGCLDQARSVCYGMCVIASNANIVKCGAFKWTMLRFCNVCNSAKDFFSISRMSCCRSARNAAVSVCALLFRLNEIDVHLFCDLFVSMLLQK